MEVAGSPERPDLTGFGRAATVGGSQVALGGDEQSGGGAQVGVDGGTRGCWWLSGGEQWARAQKSVD